MSRSTLLGRGRRGPSLLALACVLGTAGPPANAAAPDRLTLQTDRVVIFKDGHGLVVKSATGTADADGAVFSDEVPAAAILGTFWAVADEGRIRSVRAEWTEETTERRRTTPCVSVLELLRANVGRSLRIERVDGIVVAGVVSEVLELPAPSTLPTPAVDRSMLDELRDARLSEIVQPIQPGGGSLVVIDDDAGVRRTLPISLVRSVEAPGLVTTIERREQVTVRAKRLRFDLGPERAGQKTTIRLMYFAPGLRWIPTYRLTGALESTGDLALQGEILNELEDLRDTRIDLVVGVPNFRFKSVVSPLALERTLVNALASAAPNLMGQMSNAALYTQRAGEIRGRRDGMLERTGAPDLPAELTATGEQSLFVYSVDGFSLARGERAAVALWRSTVPLRHLYTMDVQVVRHARMGSTLSGPAVPGGGASPLRLGANPVWHQLELANRSRMPWTTGAALLLKGMLPLGQELLTYTPPGGRALVPVTVAVDVRGTYAEEETGREANALHWGGYAYARVRKRGVVTLTNYREETIRVRVTVACGGRATRASDDGAITVNEYRDADWAEGRFLLNNHSDVVWEITLEPGETRTLTTETEFYVR